MFARKKEFLEMKFSQLNLEKAEAFLVSHIVFGIVPM